MSLPQSRTDCVSRSLRSCEGSGGRVGKLMGLREGPARLGAVVDERDWFLKDLASL